ncbi:DNA ligase 1 [Polyergus mexicanus]|uniref:DNA ligase 1 n=1 Tax=Polyergus mexicanus TaxID=615972 RepID=UPI0038B43D91
MSMLAERRQKQKWSLNPRGKWWSEDSNKFGQRMLEKMGWTKGKGLGINEQGITEYLNVPYKKDTAGIGYDNNVDVWMEHQEKFNNFLQRLHRNENKNIIQKLEREDDSGQSMELKSKQSRARIHYKKFTRGKDINKYKPKDLANIFGQKELTNQVQIKTEKNDDIYEKKAISIGKNKNETITINSGNMTDYFKHKSNDKNFSTNTINNPATDSESETKQYAGFGFASKTENILSNGMPEDINEKNNYAFDNPCLGLNSPTEIMLSNIENTCKKSAKKRKKEYASDSLHATEVDKHNSRKKLKTEIIDGNCKDGFTNPALNLDINFEKDCNGKEFEVSRAQFGLENCGLDLTDEKSDKKSVTFNDHIILYEYNVDSTKERKGKATLDKFEVENKKRQRKRKQKSITISVSNGFVNEALDIETVCEEINDNKLNEHKSKKTKKRKISKISSLETIQESPEREKEITEVNIESEDNTNIVKNGETEIPDKKLKKKEKKKKIEIEIITVIDNISDESGFETEEIIRDKKIKKSKEEEIVTSKKHKKEKKKNKENYKIEKCAIQTEISSDQQNIEILDKTNSKQQQNYLIMDESKDATGIETLPVIGIKKEEENATLEKQQKKKKKKGIDNEDCFRNECDIKEIFDKENIGKKQDLDPKKLEKKDKKRKKSKEKNISEIEDSIDSKSEIMNGNTIVQKKVENVESTHTPLKKSRIIESIDNIMHSPWSAKARIPKKMLINLFQNNELLDFPGSNIRNIKGYGVDIECST